MQEGQIVNPQKKKSQIPYKSTPPGKIPRNVGEKKKEQEEHQVVEFIQVKGKGNQKGVQ